MKPENNSHTLLSITRSKAKMFEYGKPENDHIKIRQNPEKLLTLTIGIIGDFAANINRGSIDEEEQNALRQNLSFSAYFFDAYLQSKLNSSINPYLMLLGSASYYLCDLPGSSKVLSKQIGQVYPNLDGEGLEHFLTWLLQGDYSTSYNDSESRFSRYIGAISKKIVDFFKDGENLDDISKLTYELRDSVYKTGTPRQLLLGDIIAAVFQKKSLNSCWKSLPYYSGISQDKWKFVLQKKSFIKEFWPAQHLLGKEGVLKGNSAVVQMPTSAGKTKAIELIIRSAFLGERTNLATIVAPFRALCHEIKNDLVQAFQDEKIKINEMSDVLQPDFEIGDLTSCKQILVITPEKLLYVLRRAPNLTPHIGLTVFDEGHQFDSGARGITYELLLTSLRSMLPENAQKILISAVISNADAIGTWLNGTNSKTVSGTSLIPTFRSVGFASWQDQLGSVKYVSNKDIEKDEFYVPKVIESYKLNKKGRERIDRFFPDKTKNNKAIGKEVALYLGLKLLPRGAVAVFCGRKDTASGLSDIVVERFSRDIPIREPSESANPTELLTLKYLYTQNLGVEASATKSAQLGIFSHHGNTPHGIRLAVEYAMRKGLISFVICTSTLAQGVNLPIRYLIVTSVYQGKERIKVRDFHNLIGRVGRAGMHTEGSILFADPVIYDERKSLKNKWRWEQTKELLDPSNSEPCISNLLSLFEPIKSDNGEDEIRIDVMDIVEEYTNSSGEVAEIPKTIFGWIESDNKGLSYESFEKKIRGKLALISSIESFLLSNGDKNGEDLSKDDADHLAEETLAFSLADKDIQIRICRLFRALAENISRKVSNLKSRKIYGRSLYGLRKSQEILQWMQENMDQILSIGSDNEILHVVWPLLSNNIHNNSFHKCDNRNVLEEVCQSWIQGESFYDILNVLKTKEARLIWGTQRRDFKIDHIVDICENGFAYDGVLLIGALIEFLELVTEKSTKNVSVHLQLFQKRLKHGLPKVGAISLYELGFSDRVVAIDLMSSFELKNEDKASVIKKLKDKSNSVEQCLKKFPSYFSNIYRNLYFIQN